MTNDKANVIITPDDIKEQTTEEEEVEKNGI